MADLILNDLAMETDKFLQLHWPKGLWLNAPNWSEPWFMKGEMPSGAKQGVYALLNNNREVIYIGVGASFGSGIYEGCGLGSRTTTYTRVASNQRGVPIKERRYIPSKEWQNRGLVAISTFGLEKEHAYLSYGLEAYLLSMFSPKYNKIRATRRKNA
jgi:hypothetical protein